MGFINNFALQLGRRLILLLIKRNSSFNFCAKTMTQACALSLSIMGKQFKRAFARSSIRFKVDMTDPTTGLFRLTQLTRVKRTIRVILSVLGLRFVRIRTALIGTCKDSHLRAPRNSTIPDSKFNRVMQYELNRTSAERLRASRVR